MDFSNLRKKEDTEMRAENIHEVDNIAVVSDFYSALVCDAFIKRDEDCIFIAERALELNDLCLKGPSMRRVYGNYEAGGELTESVFFKDQKFRSFGGRTKPMKLQQGEEYLSYPRLNVEDLQIDNDDKNKINTKLTMKKIVSIEADDCKAVLEMGDGTTYKTSTLYWPLGLLSFVDLLKNKNSIDEKILEKLSDFEGPIPLFIDFYLDRDIDESRTIFLPVSFTHEEGHFIGEIKKINEKKFQFSFVHFIDPNEVNEEHICRLIKNLKRQLERVFKLEKSSFIGEEIFLSPLKMASSIDDSLSEAVQTNFPFLRIIGDQYSELETFADSCASSQSAFRGYKSVDTAMLSNGKSVDKNDRGLNTYN